MHLFVSCYTPTIIEIEGINAVGYKAIRKLDTKDIDTVVRLWYETSLIEHNFIPATSWEENMEAMASIYLPNSETYVAIGSATQVPDSVNP